MGGRNSERDFFFVSVGGWDMHSNMKESLATKFQQVDDALQSFVAEMRAQGNWEKVVLFSSSEFGRTLDSNGGGSDHGWAGNHFVISGSLQGKRVFNKFPVSLAEGNRRDLGRGRLIPEYPWESMLVPIAAWLGVEDNAMSEVFPNIGNFNSTHLTSMVSNVPRIDLVVVFSCGLSDTRLDTDRKVVYRRIWQANTKFARRFEFERVV